ncbi:hypothetical protein ABEY43_07025 [Priestia megaterium]
MGEIYVKRIEDNKKFLFHGYIEERRVSGRIDVIMTLRQPANNYKEFSSSSINTSKEVNVLDVDRETIYRSCLLITSDGVNFTGSACKAEYYLDN